MTRKGKIARLPVAIREELNQRLENGEQGVRLIEWLNSLPEVKAVLERDFEGQAISEANFSQWRNGGFLDWQAVRKAEAMVERWGVHSSQSSVFSFQSDGAAGSPMSNGGSATGNQSPMSGTVAEVLNSRLMVHYAAALEDAIGEPDDKSHKRVQQLGRSLQDVARVRRYELAREQVEISREWVAIERERLELERARLRTQARGASGVRDNAEQERLSHLEKAEIVKQMLRDA